VWAVFSGIVFHERDFAAFWVRGVDLGGRRGLGERLGWR
jgi:hypothetical protein